MSERLRDAAAAVGAAVLGLDLGPVGGAEARAVRRVRRPASEMDLFCATVAAAMPYAAELRAGVEAFGGEPFECLRRALLAGPETELALRLCDACQVSIGLVSQGQVVDGGAEDVVAARALLLEAMPAAFGAWRLRVRAG